MIVKGDITYRLADYSEKQKVIDFVNGNFDMKLPLINNDLFFEYYYHQLDNLQFCIAESSEGILACAGYIRSSLEDDSPIWVSIWVAKKGFNGVGLSLMDAVPTLTGSRLVACNNIRPETCVFYRFLGWTAERMNHYYRIAPKNFYNVCLPATVKRKAVSGDLYLHRLTPSDFNLIDIPSSSLEPHKDKWYLNRRYFSYPLKQYNVYSVQDIAGSTLAILVISQVEAFYEEDPDTKYTVLRIVDFIGDPQILPRAGIALDQLLLESGAEYIDCYNVGIDNKVWAETGFCERAPDDEAIIPNYLTSILRKNTDYYYFTSDPENFVMFKADGDQDRPHI